MTDSDNTQRSFGPLAPTLLVLSAVGFATSVYLTNLYVDATAVLKGAVGVDPFCNVGERFNCLDVAMSEYAAFLGIPVAVWGLEFFGFAFLLVGLAMLKRSPLAHWQSLLFVLSCVGVPITISLGYIAQAIIGSMCIMCMLVYAVNTANVLVLGISNRKKLRDLVSDGPAEVFRMVSNSGPKRLVLAALAVLALSQLFWVPPIFERPSQKPTAPIDFDGMPASRNTLGPPEAPIRIEEFTDFQCPYCGQAHRVMLDLMKRNPGKIHLIHRDFPLDHKCNPAIKEPFHPDACEAAYFARCAADQDKYWPFEALLFHEQKKLKPAAMYSFAEKVGIDRNKLAACVASDTTHQAVLADINEGSKRGVLGTPAFFVNGEMISGLRPIEFWQEKIEQLLNPGEKQDASSTPEPTDPTTP